MKIRNAEIAREVRRSSKRTIATGLVSESLEPRALLASNVADSPYVRAVDAPPPRTFGTGQAMTFVLKFDERVTVTPGSSIPVEVGIGRRQAEYVSGSGTRSIIYRLTASDNDIDIDGIRLGAKDGVTGIHDFDFGGSVRSLRGHAASDAIPPVRTRLPRVDGTGPNIAVIGEFEIRGNRLSVIVRFDRPIHVRRDVTPGEAVAVRGHGTSMPTIQATIDGEAVTLRYAAGRFGGGPSRFARFVHVAERNLDGADISLSSGSARLIDVPEGISIRDRFGNRYDEDATRTGDFVIDGHHRSISVSGGSTVTITETGRVSGDLLVEKGVVYGQGDFITIVNDGIVETVIGNNAPAIFIEGSFAKVTNNGELRLGGNNSPGIEIRGDDAVVENAGFIHSEFVGFTADEPGRELGNNEGISVVGLRAKVTVTGRFEGRAGNAEYVSMSGDDLTLIAAASAETFGIQSEIYSISGTKSDDPAHGFTANVQGVYVTHERESEFVSITALGGKLDIDASFESFGKDSEGVSISGGNVTSTIAGSITTHGDGSEGISISHLPSGIGGNLTTTSTATITTGGDDSEGISLQADNSSLSVSGNILTSGRDSEGISVTGSGIDSNFESGSIVTSGFDSEGFSISGGGVSLTSAKLGGEIRTSGDDAEGISITGNSIAVVLTGQTFTSGLGSEGISIKGDNIFVQIDGSIFTSGNLAPGIVIEGNDITVVINGSITTTSADSPAILVAGGSNITIDCGPNASATSENSALFANPGGVHVTGDCPWIG